MITVTLKAHHWTMARRDLNTLHWHNTLSSIALHPPPTIFGSDPDPRKNPETGRSERREERKVFYLPSSLQKKRWVGDEGERVRNGGVVSPSVGSHQSHVICVLVSVFLPYFLFNFPFLKRLSLSLSLYFFFFFLFFKKQY